MYEVSVVWCGRQLGLCHRTVLYQFPLVGKRLKHHSHKLPIKSHIRGGGQIVQYSPITRVDPYKILDSPSAVLLYEFSESVLITSG